MDAHDNAERGRRGARGKPATWSSVVDQVRKEQGRS